jgi:phosphoribosylformimino-5-aminoimidazole carboxamide ribotide isomerase
MSAADIKARNNVFSTHAFASRAAFHLAAKCLRSAHHECGEGALQIIPVLDLKSGQVVRAAGGQRGRYHPIITPLSASAAPADVVCGLRRVYPFDTFYVADLDAIDGGTTNSPQLQGIPEIWLDAGFSDEHAVQTALKKPECHAVIGTESQIDTALLQRFRGNQRIILSLDFFADGYRGPETILREPGLWPDRVIVMTLAKVGSAAGPDVERLRSVKDLAGDRKIYAAGGIRDERDLQMLMELGVAGALVASSLHDGTLTAEIIENFSSVPS